MCLGFSFPVPGFSCSAPNVITVASGRAVAGKIPGVNVPEAIEKSCTQREDKPDVGVRRNRCLLSEVNYSLNYRLRTYGEFHRFTSTKVMNDVLPRLEKLTALFLKVNLVFPILLENRNGCFTIWLKVEDRGQSV